MPQIRSSKLVIDSISDRQIRLVARLWVRNKMPIALRADSVRCTFSINGQEVIKTRHAGEVRLKALDSSLVVIPLVIFSKKLENVLKQGHARHKDTAVYLLKVVFYTNWPFFDKIEWEADYHWPLIYIPILKVKSMQIDSADIKRLVLGEVCDIDNKNVFPLKGRDTEYTFSMAGKMLARGKIPGILDIKARSITEVNFPIRMGLKNASNSVFDLLRQGKETKYDFTLRFRTVSDDPVYNNNLVIIKDHGTINSLLELRKKIKEKEKRKHQSASKAALSGNK